MLTNYHTHTTFCDGKNTPEEIVKHAIAEGFDALGFSGHGYTPFDLSCCLKDTEAYIKEIKRLKTKYKDKLQIYLGIEEDGRCPVERIRYDYIIGSMHYIKIEDKYYSLDASKESFLKILDYFDNSPVNLAKAYYEDFLSYISLRKPDVIGHFDIITKYDEVLGRIFLDNKEYGKIAEEYVTQALKYDLIFEVNTGAISRGYRTSCYPYINLLEIIKNNDGKIMISTDSHKMETLNTNFKEAKDMLYDIGFRHIYHLYNDEFIKEWIK